MELDDRAMVFYYFYIAYSFIFCLYLMLSPGFIFHHENIRVQAVFYSLYTLAMVLVFTVACVNFWNNSDQQDSVPQLFLLSLVAATIMASFVALFFGVYNLAFIMCLASLKYKEC